MRGRPIVPHCPSAACREALSQYIFWAHRPDIQSDGERAFEVAVEIATGPRPEKLERPPAPEREPAEPLLGVRRNRRTVPLYWYRCPACGYRWLSSIP